MLRQHFCIPLEIMVLLYVEAVAESSTAYCPNCPAVLHIRIVELEWMPRMLQSISQEPQMHAEDPCMYLVMSHQRVEFFTKLWRVHLENNFSNELLPKWVPIFLL